MASPAFQFYAKDWLIDTRELGPYGRGVLVDMIALCWENGSIADDAEKVAGSVGADPKIVRRLWPDLRSKFGTLSDQPGRLFNMRLEVEREKQAEHSAKQSVKGTKSAEARARAKVQQRFNRGSTVVAAAVQPEGQPEPNRNSTLRIASASAVGSKEPTSKIAAPVGPPPHEPAEDDEPADLAAPKRQAYLDAIASASSGRFVASKPTKGGVFKVDAARKRPNALDEAKRIGQWLASGGDAWRGTLDGRHVGPDLDAWIAQSSAWETAGRKSAVSTGAPRPGRITGPAEPSSFAGVVDGTDQLANWRG